jgi:hypothetical protein
VATLPPEEERCCFCRSRIRIEEWAARPGWLEVDCPVCGRYRVERQFWLTAHYKKARQPVRYRALARWLEATRERPAPPEIPFEGWERLAPGS